MPPKGGYPAIRHRYLSPGKGVNMRVAWALMGVGSVWGLYSRRAERDYITNITDDFHARNMAVTPYMQAENQMKDLVSLHYDKEYRNFVAPSLKLDPAEFFNHPIPGAVGEYTRKKQPKRSTAPKFTWMSRDLPTEPFGQFSNLAGPDKYERMLGFAVHEGPAF